MYAASEGAGREETGANPHVILAAPAAARGGAMARASNTDQRREQIVRGLLRVMARHGYAGATIPAIAREADLLPGLVHYHFDTKKAILLALVALLEASVRARYERLAARAEAPRERLYAFLDAHVAKGPGADPDAVACWVALGAEAVADREVRAAYRGVVERELAELRSLIGPILLQHGRLEAAARDIAAALLAAIEGAFRLAVVAEGAAREGYASIALRRMADGLIAGAPRPHPELDPGPDVAIAAPGPAPRSPGRRPPARENQKSKKQGRAPRSK